MFTDENVCVLYSTRPARRTKNILLNGQQTHYFSTGGNLYFHFVASFFSCGCDRSHTKKKFSRLVGAGRHKQLGEQSAIIDRKTTWNTARFFFCVLHGTIMAIRVLVTGGTGLVGNAIKDVIAGTEKRDGEEWFFVGSKEADLT